MKRPISGNLETWTEWTIDKAVTVGAHIYIRRTTLLELVAVASVVYGVHQIYSPAAWVVAGVLTWLIALGIEKADVPE